MMPRFVFGLRPRGSRRHHDGTPKLIYHGGEAIVQPRSDGALPVYDFYQIPWML